MYSLRNARSVMMKKKRTSFVRLSQSMCELNMKCANSRISHVNIMHNCLQLFDVLLFVDDSFATHILSSSSNVYPNAQYMFGFPRFCINFHICCHFHHCELQFATHCSFCWFFFQIYIRLLSF